MNLTFISECKDGMSVVVTFYDGYRLDAKLLVLSNDVYVCNGYVGDHYGFHHNFPYMFQVASSEYPFLDERWEVKSIDTV